MDDDEVTHILQRIDSLEGELVALRQQLASSLVRREAHGEVVAIMECVVRNTRFGLLFDDVVEILPVATPVTLPDAQPWILGTLNLRGDSIVVLDMGRRLLGEAHFIEPTEFIVVYSDRHHRVGLLVDDVLDITTHPSSDLQHPAPGVAFAPYLMAIIHDAHRSLPVLEIGHIAADVRLDSSVSASSPLRQD